MQLYKTPTYMYLYILIHIANACTQPHKSLVVNVLSFTFREIAIVLRIVHRAALHLLFQILVVMRRGRLVIRITPAATALASPCPLGEPTLVSHQGYMHSYTYSLCIYFYMLNRYESKHIKGRFEGTFS